MGPVLVLWILLSTAACDLIEVTVYPGDNVTLPCRSADSSISVLEWSRPDLEPDYVLLTVDGRLDPYDQHPSFKDRVELVDRDLKDGDVSLTLKNVNINDAGIYECRVAPGGSRREKRAILDSEPIRIIRLQVTEPGSDSGYSKDENPKNDVPEDGPFSPRGRYVVLAAVCGLLLATVVAVISIMTYKIHKDMRPGPTVYDDKLFPFRESPPYRGGGVCAPNESESCVVWSSELCRVSHGRLVTDEGQTKSDSLTDSSFEELEYLNKEKLLQGKTEVGYLSEN